MECYIESTPNPITGLDPDGKAAARARFVGDPICEYRLVAIPIIESFPSSGSSEAIMVLGIATFAIAKWDRIADPDWGDALAADRPGEACGAPALVSSFGCGMVWGYPIEGGVQPPHFLLQRISENDNGLAPNMIALVESDTSKKPSCLMDQKLGSPTTEGEGPVYRAYSLPECPCG